jgi:hypothetical protein
LVGVEVGVVRRMRFIVEGSEVVLCTEFSGGVRWGLASGCRGCEALIKRRARRGSLLREVLVDFHSGGLR